MHTIVLVLRYVYILKKNVETLPINRFSKKKGLGIKWAC